MLTQFKKITRRCQFRGENNLWVNCYIIAKK